MGQRRIFDPRGASPPLWRIAERTVDRGSGAQPRAFRWVAEAALPLSMSIAACVLALMPFGLTRDARLAIIAFAVAAVLWATTRLNAGFVGLSSVMMLVLAGAVPQKQLYAALASDIIWLMIGAFIIAGALRETGLATRMTHVLLRRATTVGGAFWALTTAIIPLAMFIPSTSGRAAMILPVFNSLVGVVDDRQTSRALALLVPTIILVSTMMSLIGAGSHLIANDLLAQASGHSISFAEWALFSVPFGVVASYLSCALILRMFLGAEARGRPLQLSTRAPTALSRREWTVLGVVTTMIGLWITQEMHGFEVATVTMAGALILCLPWFGVMTWQAGLKAVSWNLIIFVGAALVLGRALIEADVASLVVENLFAASSLEPSSSTPLVLVLLSGIALTSHIYMPSHAARAAALVPPLLYVADTLQLDPVAVVLISNVGIDYCLTFPVSSKALLVYQELDGDTFTPADLLRLSAVLLPVHLVLIVIFYYSYWRWMGYVL